MKEALERIRIAEEKNEAARKSQEADLTQLRSEKEQALANLVEDLRTKRGQLREEHEEKLQRALAQEKTTLEQEAKAERQSFQTLYEARHEALVNEIIERVTSTYGG